MQTYLRAYCLYNFNRRRASKARYIAKNFPESKKHQKHAESNMEYKNSVSAKG